MLKGHFLKKLTDLERRNAAAADDADKQAHIRARRATEQMGKLQHQLRSIVQPVFEDFADVLNSREIRTVTRFDEGVTGRMAELPPLAEVTIDRGPGRHYVLSYRLDGASFVMRMALGGMERRAILPPPRLTQSRVRNDLDALMEAALAASRQART